MNAVYVLWIRQIKRYLRSRPRIIGALGQPLLFLIALGYGFGSIFQRAGQGNYIDFLVPGIIAQTVVFTAIFTGIDLIWDRQFGFLKETMVAPVSRFSIILGRTLGGATIATLQGVIVLLLSLILKFHIVNWAMLPLAILAMFILALAFTALGTAIATRLSDFQAFQLIINFIIMPLFFLSGALFPLTNLPSVMNIIVKINPLTYGVDAIRRSLINIGHLSFALDFAVITLVSVALLAIGSYLFSKIEA